MRTRFGVGTLADIVPLLALLLVPPLVLGGTQLSTYHANVSLEQAPNAVHTIAARSAVMPSPEHAPSAFVTAPRPLTAAQIARAQVLTDKNYPTWAQRRAATVFPDAAAGPPPFSQVVPAAENPRPVPVGGRRAQARLLERLIPLQPSMFGLAVRVVAEPAIALGDSVMWVTGNWFAARSPDQGASWQYADPYSDFPTFTSDQDTVFDPGRRLFIWYRQGGLVPGTLHNSFRLNVSQDGAVSWCGYTVSPTDLDPSWATLDFDFPHLALSNHYLYISTTFLVTGNGFASPRMALLRMPLDGLASCTPFAFVFWTSNEGWSWMPVDSGATRVMYVGDTLDSGGTGTTGVFRVYAQAETSTSLTYVDRSVPAWTFTERTGLCPVLGGGNPCSRADQRITSGWLRQHNGRGEVGFLWDVRDGAGFPLPYVDGVTLDQETLEVTGRPLLWDSACAWQYGAAAPTARGELGITAFYLCPAQPPAHAIGFARESRRGASAAPWQMFYTRTGDVPTATVIWGDYLRVRAAGLGFVATGYTVGLDGAEPFLVRVGR